MKRRALALLALLFATTASAQNVTVIGPVTPGNVPVFNSTTVIKDSGLTPSTGSVNWINVKQAPCNAVGNGVADDTAAINTCIAQFNSAAKGTLYFPAGTYKVTAALTPITANGIIRGDGQVNLLGQNGSAPPTYPGPILPATLIQETSGSAVLFSVTQSQLLLFSDLALQNTSVSAPVTGSVGILVNSATLLTATAPTSTSSPTLTFASVPGTVANGQGVYDVTTGKVVGTVLSVSSPTVTLTANASNPVATNDVVSFGGILGQKVDYQNIQVSGFNINVDVKVGAGWSMHNFTCNAPVVYCVRINNVINADAGDWSIDNAWFYTIPSGGAYSGATSAIRVEGSGGAKIVNSKINAAVNNGTGFTTGLDIVGIGSTVDLDFANSSIENIAAGGTAISVVGLWPNITIQGIEIGYNQGTGLHAINIANTNTVTISDIVLANPNYSGAVIALNSSCSNCYVSGVMSNTPVSLFTGTGGSAPDHDGTGGIGGNQYFAFTAPATLTWTDNVFNNAPLLGVTNPNSGGWALIQSANDLNVSVGIQATGSATGVDTQGQGQIGATTQLNVISDSGSTSGGTHGVSVRAGGFQNSNETLLVQSNGHISIGNAKTLPTLTAGCNGAGSVVTGNDVAGTITGQTAAATTCTLTFGTAYAAAPFCIAVGNTAPLTGAITAATGTLVVNFPSTANFKWTYQCFGK